MSFSNYTIYCAIYFFNAQYKVFLCRPVQHSKATLDAVKGILKGSILLPLCLSFSAANIRLASQLVSA